MAAVAPQDAIECHTMPESPARNASAPEMPVAVSPDAGEIGSQAAVVDEETDKRGDLRCGSLQRFFKAGLPDGLFANQKSKFG
jgi:hypothetical protein